MRSSSARASRVKPKHGSPDFARDVAMQKIKARLEGARLASTELADKLVTAWRFRRSPGARIRSP